MPLQPKVSLVQWVVFDLNSSPMIYYPQHIAIIPDGNRTRATLLGQLKHQGHHAGFKNSIDLAKYVFSHTPIKVFSLRWLSTENLLERSKQELDYLFKLFKMVTDELRSFLIEQQVSFRRVGDTTWLPEDLITYLNEQQQLLSFDSERNVILCINYGGRNEIIRGIKKRSEAGGDVTALSEQSFSQFLDFGSFPAVDLVIRTKGELARRLSGFMLRWIGYAELFFSKLNFPDFGIHELKEALERFHERASYRNFGK